MYLFVLHGSSLTLCLKLFLLLVLQKVCLLQRSADSVQESMGPSDDVQKHDTVIFCKILPWCVTNSLLSHNTITSAIFLSTESVVRSLYRWRGAGSGGCGRKRPHTDFTARQEDLGEIRVRHSKSLSTVLHRTQICNMQCLFKHVI